MKTHYEIQWYVTHPWAGKYDGYGEFGKPEWVSYHAFNNLKTLKEARQQLKNLYALNKNIKRRIIKVESKLIIVRYMKHYEIQYKNDLIDSNWNTYTCYKTIKSLKEAREIYHNLVILSKHDYIHKRLVEVKSKQKVISRKINKILNN